MNGISAHIQYNMNPDAFASIIIPVYNDSTELEKVLQGIGMQTFSRDRFEVIVVDNGSTDNTRDLVKRSGDVICIVEDHYPNSPYSCRNRGLEVAKGDVIVLLDGTCIPEPDWLEQGMACLEKSGADIVSSHVIFDFRNRVTAGKLYDSNNLSTETAMKLNGVAKTASLFIKKKVFDKVGRFPEGVRSGADVRWTSRAFRMGFNMEFCYGSVARKKARSFTESVRKQWRVGKGQPAIRREQGTYLNPWKLLAGSLIPPHPSRVRKLSENKGVEVTPFLTFKLYFVAWFIWVTMALANMYSSFFLKEEKQDPAHKSDHQVKSEDTGFTKSTPVSHKLTGNVKN
jgi:glycosyltransferase AglE